MNSNLESLKVRLVFKNRKEYGGWILEKFAVRLAENLPNWNVDLDIADQPSQTADINHWIWYYDADSGKTSPKTTVFVTHVDRPVKLLLLSECLKRADLAICMSRMAVEELSRRGIKRDKLCYITPAHDSLVTPRRIVIGITSRVRGDKAKREDLLIKLAQKMKLNTFHFEILGRGWERVVHYLEAAGATVRYFPGTDDGIEDYRINLERVSTFDYYLYLGFDEGSMGFLDALAAGVPTIVTPQGFHLDINNGITHPVSDFAQLCDVFNQLASKRQRLINSVSDLTWNEYARQHAIAWRAILNGRQNALPNLLHENIIYTTPLPYRSYKEMMLEDIQFYSRMTLSTLNSDLQMLLKRYFAIDLWNTTIWRFLRAIKEIISLKRVK